MGTNSEEILKLFKQITRVVKRSENYVPRDYQTIGGMWTVDTYKVGDITVQLMDEGYTNKLITPTIEAIETGSSFRLERGSLQDFEETLKLLG